MSWINHLPPACWSTFRKSNSKQQLGCRFDIVDYESYFFVFWHMQLYMSWYIISFFGFTFLNIFIFSSTLVLTFSYRRNLYTFYMKEDSGGIDGDVKVNSFIAFIIDLALNCLQSQTRLSKNIKPFKQRWEICTHILSVPWTRATTPAYRLTICKYSHVISQKELYIESIRADLITISIKLPTIRYTTYTRAYLHYVAKWKQHWHVASFTDMV